MTKWISHNRDLGFTKSIQCCCCKRVSIVFKSTLTRHHLALLNKSLHHHHIFCIGIYSNFRSDYRLHCDLTASTAPRKLNLFYLEILEEEHIYNFRKDLFSFQWFFETSQWRCFEECQKPARGSQRGCRRRCRAKGKDNLPIRWTSFHPENSHLKVISAFWLI